MKKLTAGVIAGFSSLALAVPVFAQVSGGSSSAIFTRGTPAFAPENIQQMIERDQALLDNIDQMVVILKDATQTHKNALTAAQGITDDTARGEAVRTAQEAFHSAMQSAIEANPELKGVLHGGMMGKGHHGMRGKPDKGMLAEKLGMTQDELQAAIESGKTIEQIADEKGIELPVRIMKIRGGGPLAEKLGMTEDELKAALESGKTIKELAEEKGIELPGKPMFMHRMEIDSSNSSAL